MLIHFQYLNQPYTLNTMDDMIRSNQGYTIPRRNASDDLRLTATRAKVAFLQDEFRTTQRAQMVANFGV
jgi:hypothetical protein